MGTSVVLAFLAAAVSLLVGIVGYLIVLAVKFFKKYFFTDPLNAIDSPEEKDN